MAALTSVERFCLKLTSKSTNTLKKTVLHALSHFSAQSLSSLTGVLQSAKAQVRGHTLSYWACIAASTAVGHVEAS
jgi:hypothetical protein